MLVNSSLAGQLVVSQGLGSMDFIEEYSQVESNAT
jgi:hypothetical protein